MRPSQTPSGSPNTTVAPSPSPSAKPPTELTREDVMKVILTVRNTTARSKLISSLTEAGGDTVALSRVWKQVQDELAKEAQSP